MLLVPIQLFRQRSRTSVKAYATMPIGIVGKNSLGFLKVASYCFLSARALISKISRWRKRSNSKPKSRARSRSKMPTNMVSKLLKFVYGKCCVDRRRFQNICRLNRRPCLSLLDLKEKCTRHAGVSTNEADLFDRHDHRAEQSKMVY